MNDVIHLAERQQVADMKHVLGASAEEPTTHSQQQVDNPEEHAEASRSPARTGKAKVQGDRPGDEVHCVVREVEVCTQQLGLHKSRDADQNEDNTQELTNRLCHDLYFSFLQKRVKAYSGRALNSLPAANQIAM
jgi:hypothetical protein